MITEVDGLDARMDPWCTVPQGNHGDVLFGFAERHHRTGGLAWTRSSPVMFLDNSRNVARTYSGTLFSLGERFQSHAVADLGVEAQLAFKLLFGDDTDFAHVAPLLLDRAMGVRWLTACKAARHLAVPLPPPSANETNTFLRRHGPAYRRRRATGWFIS